MPFGQLLKSDIRYTAASQKYMIKMNVLHIFYYSVCALYKSLVQIQCITFVAVLSLLRFYRILTLLSCLI